MASPATGEPGPRLPLDMLVGPRRLGRSVVITGPAPVPEQWSDCPVVSIGPDAEPDDIERVHRAWRERERLAIRWSGPERSPADFPAATLKRPFHELEPTSDVPGERLAMALTANAVWVDGNSDDSGWFQPMARALALAGAASGKAGVDDAGRIEAARLDSNTTAPDHGDSVHVDGGPLDLGLAEPVIPRVHLVAGLLRVVQPDSPLPDSAVELAPDQRAAVIHRCGPARILAPAGSGKTRVLTERTRFLVQASGIAPNVTSLVAYNRRAREEMEDRLGPASGRSVGPVSIRTLNSLALAISAGRHGFAPPHGGQAPATITEPEVRRILSRIIPGRRRRQLTDPLEPWVDALSACRLGLRHPEEVTDAYGGDIDGFPEVLDRYRNELGERNLIDFDEQVVRAVERLATEPEAREQARAVAPVLLVDEFQDLTPAHLLLIRLLAGPAAEVFAVGDDDQTIYGYSGASPRWLVHFDRYFPGAADHPLTVNYRCPEPVVDAASNLLSHNRFRVEKTITAGNTGNSADGVDESRAESLGLVAFNTGDPQQNLVDHIKQLVDGGEAGTMAVLARVNAALMPPALFLEAAGISTVRPPGLDESMLNRSGASAALAWLRLATGPSRRFQPDDVRLVLRRPPRSLHPRIVDWVCEQESVSQMERLAQRLNTERDSQSVQSLADDIAALRSRAEAGATTEQLLAQIYEQVGLLGAAGQLDGSQRSARRAAHSDDLSALLAVSRLQTDPEEFESWLRDALERPEATSGPVAVTLATIHTTKGLEWDHVVVHDCRLGLYPHRLADDVEEERRIFHVGITRGRKSVALTAGGPPSPFLPELTKARSTPWPADDSERAVSEGGADRAGPGGKNQEAPSRPERAEPADPDEAALRDALTQWRSRRAKADSVPAYIVLNNRTLDTIARQAPTSLKELAAIPGIGPAKLENYGDEILGIVG